LSDRPLDPQGLGTGAAAFVLRESGMVDAAALRAALALCAAQSAPVIEGLLP
jgi:hypothetical protein